MYLLSVTTLLVLQAENGVPGAAERQVAKHNLIYSSFSDTLLLILMKDILILQFLA
jgi:hypothetical protein